LVGPHNFGTSVVCPQIDVDEHELFRQGKISMGRLALIGWDPTIATTSPPARPKYFQEILMSTSSTG
jgi:hypothetical protein